LSLLRWIDGSLRCGKPPNSGVSRPTRTVSSSATRRSTYAAAASKPWHAKQTFTLADALRVKSMFILSATSAVMPSSVVAWISGSVGTAR
jgi:hypothetical protein